MAENVNREDLSVPLSVNTGAQVTDVGMGPTDFSVPNGLRYSEPTLNAANEKFSTPYYAAYTNSGDLAAATYAADGQGVRLVDPKTGQVLYSGTGPDAAKYATGLANALSEDKGRKAAWAIQVDNGDQGWTTTGSDRADPKHNLLGKIADIALPALASFLLPGSGFLLSGLQAAGGSLASSALQGRNLGDSLKVAALSGLGAGIGDKFLSPAISGVTGGGAVPATAAGAAGAPSALGAATNAAATVGGSAAGGAAGGAGTLVGELVVPGLSRAATAAGSASGGAAGGAVGGLAVNPGSAAPQAPDAPQARQPTTVDELTVTASQMAGQGLSVGQMVAAGIPAAIAIGAASGGAGAGADLAVSNAPTTQNSNLGVLDKTKEWIASHPVQAALLGLTAAGSLASGTGKANSTSFNSNAGTLASLNPIFGASLPAPTVGPRTQRSLAVDWKRYGQGPERSFFSNVPDTWAVPGVN